MFDMEFSFLYITIPSICYFEEMVNAVLLFSQSAGALSSRGWQQTRGQGKEVVEAV